MDIKELVEILIAPACMVILAAILNRKDTAFKLQLQTNEKKRLEKETAREEMWLLSIRGNTACMSLCLALADAIKEHHDLEKNEKFQEALDFAKEVKNEQKDYLNKKAVESIAK